MEDAKPKPTRGTGSASNGPARQPVQTGWAVISANKAASFFRPNGIGALGVRLLEAYASILPN